MSRPDPRSNRVLSLGACAALLLTSVALATLPAGQAAARPRVPAPWSGRVVGAADGDTVTVLRDGRGVKIRLWGVDTPEKSQDFGGAAKRFTLRTAAGKTARVEPLDVDRYGRIVALVEVDGTLLNEALVRAGYAWVYRDYCDRKATCDRWLALEEKARAVGRGLWAQPDPVPPWQFRRGARSGRRHDAIHRRSDTPERRREARPAPGGADGAVIGPFHGNTRSHKFHQPSCPHYECKRCTASFPDRAAAVKAGYEPCGWCRP